MFSKFTMSAWVFAIAVGWAAGSIAAPIEGATFNTAENSSSSIEVIQLAVAANLTQTSDAGSSPYGIQMRKGIELALADRRADILAAGLDIQLNEFDSEGDNSKVAEVAKAVLESPAVGVIGHLFSSEALTAAEVYGEAPMVYVSPGATAERLQSIGDHVVSTVFNNLEQAKMLVNAAAEKDQKTVAIINVQDCAYCEDLRLHFEVEARRSPLEVKSVQPILSDAAHLDRVLDHEALAEVDVIFLPNYERVNARVIRHLNAKGIKPNYYLGGDGWGLTSDLFQSILGTDTIKFKALTFAYWATGLKEKAALEFRDRYKNMFQSEPGDTSTLAYDGMNRLIDVALVAERPVTRQSLMNASKLVKTSKGALGPITNGDWTIQRPYVLLEYEGLDVVDSAVKGVEL